MTSADMTTATRVKIIVPSNWKALTGGELPALECQAATVQAALDWLTSTYPQFDVRLFSKGRLASWINIYLGDEDIRGLGCLDTCIESPAVLTIVQAVAGG